MVAEENQGLGSGPFYPLADSVVLAVCHDLELIKPTHLL